MEGVARKDGLHLLADSLPATLEKLVIIGPRWPSLEDPDVDKTGPGNWHPFKFHRRLMLTLREASATQKAVQEMV